MSEQEQERPLTRRELRMREQAEHEHAGAAEAPAELGDADVQAAEAHAAADQAATEAVAAEVEIDPLNPDGTPRTRREMRELREAAIAALLAEQGAGDETAVEHDEIPEPEPVEDAGVPTEALSFADLPSASGETAAAAVEDLDAPTEAFSLEDILDAAEPSSPTGDADAVANLFAGADDDEAAADEAAEDDVAADEASAGEADVVDEGEIAAVVEPDIAAEVEDIAVAEIVEPAGEADPEPVSPVAPAAAPQEDPQADEAAADAESDTGTDTAGYSFPDIQPPEEWRSVFDDPSRAANMTAPGSSGEGSGDFDDLISRAVAQEGSTGGTGASALILPSHPGDTGGLTGPLGATGELFVTGSIELPKSLGETGGHSALHDSVELDPYLTGEHVEPLAATSESGPMPVSALSAVSARRRPEVPVVAEPTKDRSKTPLILALSGGGLIIVLAGAVIFAATQGMFG